jgi:predicted dehydrogenase
MKKLNIGFLGGGITSAVGRAHKSAIAIDGQFDLVGGVFSRHEDTNKESATAYGLDERKAFESIDELISETQLDLLAIITPSPVHKLGILRAAERKISVICEKPLVSSLSDWREVSDNWPKDKHLFVVYNYTGYPMVREARSIIESRILGEPLQVIVEMPNDGFVRPPRIAGVQKPPQSWRLTDPIIPQAALDLATHAIQLVRFVTQEEVASAKANWANHTQFTGIKDTLQVIGTLTSSASFSIWTTKSAHGYRNGLNIRVLCERGSLKWTQTDPEHLTITDADRFNGVLDRSNSTGEGYNPRYDRFKVGHPSGFIEALANYYGSVYEALTHEVQVTQATSVFGLNDSFEELSILEALAESNHYERRI